MMYCEIEMHPMLHVHSAVKPREYMAFCEKLLRKTNVFFHFVLY